MFLIIFISVLTTVIFSYFVVSMIRLATYIGINYSTKEINEREKNDIKWKFKFYVQDAIFSILDLIVCFLLLIYLTR